MPAGADRKVRWDAAARAAEMAREPPAAVYSALWEQLDEVAAEFVASPGSDLGQIALTRAAREVIDIAQGCGLDRAGNG